MCVLGNFLHLSEVRGAGGPLPPGLLLAAVRGGKMCVLAGAPVRGGWKRGRAGPYGGRAAAPRLLVPYLENAAAKQSVHIHI